MTMHVLCRYWLVITASSILQMTPKNATVLVLKLYPYKVFFACVVPAKGAEPSVVSRLALFIKEMGLIHFAYRSDREPTVKALIEEACRMAGRQAKPVTTDHPMDLQPEVLEQGSVAVVEDHHQDEDLLADVRLAVP